MKISKSQEGIVTVLSIEGVIRLGESAQRFSTFLSELLAEGVKAVLLDLSKIDHVDSTGLGELVGYLQRFTGEGKRLALLNPHQRIRALLKLTSLDQVFPIYESKDEALVELGRS